MTLTIKYGPEFKREYKKLSASLKLLVKERGAIFELDPFNPSLKTHKLSGHLQKVWSFSLDHRYRVLFEFKDNNTVELLRVGDHSIYRKARG